jgi:hypothetical protein
MRRRLLGRVLTLQPNVAPAADHKSPVRGLLPIVIAVTGVVRSWEELGRKRLGREHLSSCRANDGVELRQQSTRVAIGGDHDVFGP